MSLLNKKEFKIFLTFFIIYLCFAQFQNWNDNSKLDLTRAIVDEHCFEINSYINNTGDRAYYNGHYYSDKAPGASFLTVPIYAVFKLFFRMPDTNLKLSLLEFIIIAFSSVLFSALLVVLIYKISRFFLKKESQRMLITLIFGLGTMIFVYATIYYQHIIATFFAFLCFYLIFKMKKEKKGNYYFLAGLSGGMAFITDYLTAVIIFCCFIIILFNKKWKKTFSFLLGFFLLVLILFFYNFSIFGDPFDLSYNHIDPDLNNNKINKYDENLTKLWEQNDGAIGYINFKPLFKPNEFVCAYALTYVYSPEERQVQIRTGSDDSLKLWLNNKLIIDKNNPRRAIINRDVTQTKLNKSWNKVLIKVCNYLNEFELFFVITDKKGMIYHDLKYNLFINDTKITFSRNNDYNKIKWGVIGPFDNSIKDHELRAWEFFPKAVGSGKEYPPEKEIILNKSYKGKDQIVKWQILLSSKFRRNKFLFITIPIRNGLKNVPYHFNISIRLLFYPYRGLFFYNPILILSLIGLFLMFKHYKLETILIIVSFILILLASSVQWLWWEGSSFGPRFLVSIIPFLMLPLMFCIKKINKKVLLLFMMICIFISLLGMQEFEQEISEGGNSFLEMNQKTMEKHEIEFYSMQPLGNPLFTYYMPLFFRYGPRSILIEDMLGFRLFPFLNVSILIIIVSFIWRKELTESIRKTKKDFKISNAGKK